MPWYIPGSIPGSSSDDPHASATLCCTCRTILNDEKHICAKCGHGMCPDWCAHSSAVSPDGRTEYFCYCCRTPHWAKEQPYTDDDRKLGQNTAAMTKEVRDFTRAREAQKALCPKLYPLTQERQDQLRLAEEWPEHPPWIVRISNMYCCHDQEGHHNLCGLDRKPLTKEQYERRQAQKARK